MCSSATQDKNSPYLPVAARVRESKAVSEKERFLVIETKEPFTHVPGQFVMAGIPGYGEAPISISSAPSKDVSFELCVRAVGNLTNAIHRLAPNDTLWIRGPFGRGFDREKLIGKDILFVAGGIGLVPMRSLIKDVLLSRKDFGTLTLLYGVKSPSEILFKDELEEWKKSEMDVRVTIDRPHPDWKGNVGVVTTLIGGLTVNEARTAAVLVGPPVMYKYVILSLGDKKIPGTDIHMSLERRMKCGIGKCGHCQINGVYACQEGPVFTLSEARHLKEAL